MKKLIFISLLSLIITGCSVTLVAPYDKATDDGITSLEKETDSLLFSIDSTHLTYDPKYYANLRIDLKILQNRAVALPRNNLTIEQLALLGTEIDDLEKLHKANVLSSEVIKSSQSALDRSFASIIKLELAKKR